MEKEYPVTTESHHSTDLKDAIYYLPAQFDHTILCKALKAVYDEEGKDLAREWLFKTKNNLPKNFDEFWEESNLTPYQLQFPDKYLNDSIYNTAKETGWIPKALRKGKQSKKPPSKRKLQTVGEHIQASEKLHEQLTKIKEDQLEEKEKSYISPCIRNMDGACYMHPFMHKKDIPDDREEYLKLLIKIVDCEVIVQEAIEHIIDQPGQTEDDKEVRYRLRLTNRLDKDVITIATFEELTTKTRFSSFLVSKGFVKFIGNNDVFDRFHEFLINDQEYPTVKMITSWGEYKPGEFLFENGLFDVNKQRFYPANEENRIQKGRQFLVCPTGSELVQPPIISMPTDDEASARFLAEKFMMWESFNGKLNVRATLGYAVACLFSRDIKEQDGAFPLMFKFGERGTGKSSSMDWFMSLFGYRNGNRQSVSKQNTIKGLIRNMTLPTSFPFFLDDYRNHETNSQVPDLTSPILNWYHRIGTSMAKKSTDNQTIDTWMKACVVMTGNDKPTDPAVLSRLIVLNYSKFLKRNELDMIPNVVRSTPRFSEFTALVLKDYENVRGFFMDFLDGNKKALADQGFQGRTVNNWSYVMAGIQCVPYILPDLQHWSNEFGALKTEIYEAIHKEEALQKESNPLHEFFDTLEHYATQKVDPNSEFNRRFFVLDHRHFRYKPFEAFTDANGKVYQGEVLYLHPKRIWYSLQDAKSDVTRQTNLNTLEAKLQNSSYFLNNSVQVFLTKSIDEPKESNLRCYVLRVDQLNEKGMLQELIAKAKEYEQQRAGRLSA